MQHPKYARIRQLVSSADEAIAIINAFYAPLEITGKFLDGTPLAMSWEDKGDWLPGHRSDGTRYEAFTAWYRVNDGRARLFEDYIQTPMATVPRKGAYDFLAGQRMQALRLAGIDPDSLMMDNGEPLFPKG